MMEHGNYKAERHSSGEGDKELVVQGGAERSGADFRGVPVAWGRFRLGGCLVAANEALAELLGYESRGELLETIVDVGEQLYVDVGRRAMLEGRVVADGQVRDFEAAVYRADGSVLWISETAWGVRDESGAVVLIEEVVRDITVTKDVEATILAQSEALSVRVASREALLWETQGLLAARQAGESAMRTLFNSLAVAIFLHRVDGEIVEVNNRVEALFGVSREQAQGMRFDEDFSAVANRLEQLPGYWEQALAGQPQFFEWLAQRPGDGSELEVEVYLDRVALAWGSSGVAEDLILATVRDITERKQSERERQRLLDELEHRTERLQTAAEVSRAASSELDMAALMRSSVNLIRDRFGFYYVGLFMVEGSWAVLKAGTGQAGEIQLAGGHRLRLGSGSMIGWAIEHRQARIALDVGAEAVHFKNPVLPLTRSELALPLISRERVLGALTVQSVQAAAFSEEDITLLQTMADQLANALHTAQLWQQTSQRTAELEQLYEVSRQLVEAGDVAAVYELVIETVKGYGVDRVSISLLDRDSGGEIVAVRIVATWDRDPAQRTPVGTTFSAKDFSLVETFAEPPFTPLISEDLSRPQQADARLDEPFRQLVYEQMKMQTMFSAPMFLGQEYRGVLSLYTRRPHAYGESEVRLYQMLADQAIIVIENHVLLERTRAERDRAALLSSLGQELGRCRTVAGVLEITLGYVARLWSARAEIYVTDWQGLYDFRFSSSDLGLDQAPFQTPFGKEGEGDLRLMTDDLGLENRQARIAEVLVAVNELKQSVSRGSFEIDNDHRIWCVPVTSSRSELEGALLVYGVPAGGLSESQVALFEEVGSQLTGALENVWLLHQSQTALGETEVLYQASRDFNGAQSLADLLRTLARYVSGLTEDLSDLRLPKDKGEVELLGGNTRETFGVDFLAIGEFEGERSRLDRAGVLRLPAVWLAEGGSPAVEGLVLPAEEYPFVAGFNSELATTVIYSQQPPAVQARLREQLAGRRSLLAVPLAAGNRWLGMLLVGSRAAGFDFPGAVVQQLTALGGQVAVVMQNLALAATTQQNLYRTELLSRLGEALLGAESQGAIVGACLRAVSETQPGRGAFMFLFRRAVSLEVVLAGSTDDLDELRFGNEGDLGLTNDDLRLENQKSEIVTQQSTIAKQSSIENQQSKIGSRYSEADFDFVGQILAGQEVVVPRVASSEGVSETTRQRLNLMEIDSFVALPIWLAKEVGGFLLVAFDLRLGRTEVHPTEVKNRQSTIDNRQSLYRDIARRVSDALAYQRVLEEASYRARLLQTVSEISETATATLELSSLLPETVDLIRDRLGFYHASIFLVDEYQKYAVVQASTGRAGVQMLARRHKLAVGGSSLVGRATGSGQPCLAADVYQAAAWFNNPLLPETRAELALPLISRGAVIGALDVQSKEVGAFTESDQTILQSLANQLANAIEAARAFAQNQQNLAEVQKLHEHYLQQGWRSFVRQAAGGRYEWQFRRGLMNEFEEELRITNDELGVENRHSEIENRKSVEFPLRLRGQANLGWLGLEVESAEWDEDTRQIIEAVTAQAAQAMETARLFEQTQSAREEAEVLYRLVGQLVQADSESAMYEMVLPSLLPTLGASRGGVVLLNDLGLTSDDLRLGDQSPSQTEFGKEDNQQSTINNRQSIEVCRYEVGGEMVWPAAELSGDQRRLWARLAEGEMYVDEDLIELGLENRHSEIENRKSVQSSTNNRRSKIWLPLMIEDELWGGVWLVLSGPVANVGERALNLARAMVDQLAISLQNQRLLGETARRAVQLQTSAEVSRVASSILEPQEMLRQAVTLIKERFGYHEVQIYLIDELQQQAVLQQSTGEVGQRLLALQHQVAIGSQTVIGQVTANRESLVVRYESEDLEDLRFTIDDLGFANDDMKVDGEDNQQSEVIDNQSESDKQKSSLGDRQPSFAAHSSSIDSQPSSIKANQPKNDRQQSESDTAQLASDDKPSKRNNQEALSDAQLAEAKNEQSTDNEQEFDHDLQATTIDEQTSDLDNQAVISDEQTLKLDRSQTASDDKQEMVDTSQANVDKEQSAGQPEPGRTDFSPSESEPGRTEAHSTGSVQSELGVPLQVGESLLGALAVQSVEAEAFGPEEISTLETLAAQLAVALQNARQFKEQQAAAERLREVDKLKTQFLANMSHELRTPLNSIIGFSRVILKGIDGPLTELQKADLTSIHNSGQHLLGLINNMLDLSKIEAGKMELNPEDTEMEPIIKQVMSTALALVKDKPVKLVTKVAEDIPTVWADPTRLRQVILNLVSNACKFTDEGEIVVRASASRDKVTVSVTDSGVGIPAEKLGSVFEEFTQVDASTTRKVGGTGLGLPISRHFIEMHQGQIWVESEVGRGSTFSFAIPIRPAKNGEVDESASLGSASLGEVLVRRPVEVDNRLVVAIESDPKVVALYKRFLSKHGYEVIGINNSEEIVARVKHYAPAVILLDVLLPEVDGWRVLGELRENSVTQAIPIIISSTVKDKNRAFSMGVADYLVKPIVETELVRALRNVESLERSKVKVLIVDDHADDVLLIRRMLEAQGNYKVIEANNGREGLKIVESMRPDLVICDLNMPEMNGYRVVEKLKKNEKTRHIPIIIVSAHELGQTERKYLDSQVEVLLNKALFTEQELLDVVHRALSRMGKE